MTEIDELIDELDSSLSSTIPHPYKSISAACDVYEGYLWMLVLEAAKEQGANISFETRENKPASNLIFRTSPGNIYSKAHDYTHAILDFGGQTSELEVHIGIYILGKSTVIHECDVAVIERNEGIACRSSLAHPRSSKMLLSVECKFYSSNLSIAIGRGFLGLSKDLQAKNRYFVSSATSSSVEKLISYHKANWECPVIPSEQLKVDRLKSQFANTFRDFTITGKF